MPKTRRKQRKDAMPRIATLLDAVDNANKDILTALQTGELVLTKRDMRYVVDLYYMSQKLRIAADNQARQGGLEETALTEWIYEQQARIETQINRALDAATALSEVCCWAKSIKGIGPVLSAGLYAHIDITKAPTVGHIFRFGGYDPLQKWLGRKGAKAFVPEKKKFTREEVIKLAVDARRDPQWLLRQLDGKYTRTALVSALAKRPYNAKLKTIFWKVGESFVKVSGRDSFFGDLYAKRKQEEIERNERGDNAEEAARELREKEYDKGKPAYKAYVKGKLPDARVTARARRFATKVFLSCWHEVAYMLEYKKDPPAPYAVDILGHSHWIRAKDVW